MLTTELVEGARFEEVEGWSQEERNLASEAIYRFVFRSIYQLHAFNGDPHPGNYLFRPRGHVTFLDFGLVKRYQPEEVELFEALIRTFVVEHDVTSFRRLMEDHHVLRRDPALSDADVAGYFGHFYELVLTDQVFTVDPEYSSETVRMYFDANGPYADVARAVDDPAVFVITQRINLGLTAVLGRLHATRSNFRRIAEELWPFVAGPPSTPMGEAETLARPKERTGASWRRIVPPTHAGSRSLGGSGTQLPWKPYGTRTGRWTVATSGAVNSCASRITKSERSTAASYT